MKQNKLILKELETGYTSGEDYETDIICDKRNSTYSKTPMYQYNSAAIHSVANQAGDGAYLSYTILDFNNGNYKAICTIADNIIRQINENINTDKKSQNHNNKRFSNAKHINADKCKPSVLQTSLATKFISKMQKMYMEAANNGDIETTVNEKQKILLCHLDMVHCHLVRQKFFQKPQLLHLIEVKMLYLVYPNILKKINLNIR